MDARSVHGHSFQISALVALCLLMIAAAGLVGCNEHPVEFSNSDGIYSYYPQPPSTEASKVDILWVIDNSGSMCQEQQKLREKFDEFVSEFGEKNIDFNIGVTTTHMEPNHSYEPVAVPGRLQATPQPVPSSYEGCIGDEGAADDQSDGFEGIRASINSAIACTKDSSQWQDLTQVEDDMIACAVDPNCAATDTADLFPAMRDGQSPYRTIPTVLSASDSNYQDADGYVDLAKLERDFACMSFVGTRGYAFEKGLGAAVEAVSPEMTGGTVESPTDTSAPNHGLLRDDAQLAVIFLTDENDCTHDGSLNECQSRVCEFANHPDFADDSPLIGPEELSDDFVRNVAASKGLDVDEFARRTIVVASLHGKSRRYGATPEYPAQTPPSPNTCGEDVLPEYEIDTSCFSPEFGSAYSGDRYERFMRTFDTERIYPRPDDNDRLAGLICTPDDFGLYMSGVAATIVGSVEQCITQQPRGCEESATDTCGEFAFGDGTGECEQFGKTERSFCNSAVQVRLFAEERGLEALRSQEYCIPGSLDSSLTPQGCVVKRDKYQFGDCSGVGIDAGFTIEWPEDRWFEKLRGFEIEVVVSSGGIAPR
jgi:hypothetical protein